MNDADSRLVLRQRSQIYSSDCRLKIVSQPSDNNLGGTAGGQSLRHVDNRLIHGGTGRNDPQLLFTVGRGGKVGSGAKLESLGDRRFTDVDIDRASVRRGINDPETAVGFLASSDGLAAW